MKTKGISLVEILVVISIIGIILAVATTSLSDFRNSQALRNTADDIISLLNQARSQTLASKNLISYGVHLGLDRATLFAGTSYTESDPNNQVIMFDNSVVILDGTPGGINLNGYEVDVIFDRLTGDTDQYGTIILQSNKDINKQKTITINKIGVISSN